MIFREEFFYERRSCTRDPGGKFGSGNDCAGDGTSTAAPNVGRGPSVSGDGRVAYSSKSAVKESLKLVGVSMADAKKVLAPEDASKMSIAQGGVSNMKEFIDGGDIGEEPEYAVSFFSVSDAGGVKDAITSSASLIRGDGDRLLLQYTLLGISEEGRKTAATAIGREMYKSVLDSMAHAEKIGVSEAKMFASGDSSNEEFKGYKIWPRLGFDGVIPRSSVTPFYTLATGVFNSYGSKLPDSILSPRAKQEKKAGRLTIQALYETKEGQRWWEDNGTEMVMSFNFDDKESPGYQRFKKVSDRFSSREMEWIEAEFRSLFESRDDCVRDPTGRFGEDNKCQKDAGEGVAVVVHPRLPSSPPPRKPVDLYEVVKAEPLMVRGDRGQILSSDYKKSELSPFSGREWASPGAVGSRLAAITSRTRGNPIDSTKSLADDEFEYLASSLTMQVQAAMNRGHRPLFYSSEETSRQLDVYAQSQPLMRGGVTASGFSVGESGEGIHPNAAFLYRAVQAVTSPQASPLANMQRADAALSNFFTNPDAKRARLGSGAADVGGTQQNQSLAKLQSVIDSVGLDGARELLTGKPMTYRELKAFLEDRLGLPETSSSAYKPDEIVPVFTVFGPKVGPFFANNSGDHEHLTADVWFTRTWGRLTGELMTKTNPKTAKAHAAKALKTLHNFPPQELVGVDEERFRQDLESMRKTGEVPESVISWASLRAKRYADEGYNNGVRGVRDKAVARLAVAITKNQPGTLDDPKTGGRRANMIRVMREVAKRTGISVAYAQDVLWQDEQDVWRDAGARTQTEVGVPSLYSTVIEKALASNAKKAAGKSKSKSKSKKRSADGLDEPEDFEDLGWIEQLVFDEAFSEIDPETFASELIAFLSSRDTESRSAADALAGGGHPDVSTDVSEGGKVVKVIHDGDEIDTVTISKTPAGTTVAHDGLGRASHSQAQVRVGLGVLSKSVVACRESGVSFVRVLASSESRDAGYKVWPRIGFDAAIPEGIRAELPEHLEHCVSLLDLHATREGESWWESHGVPVDVRLDLRKPGDAGSEIFSRWSRLLSIEHRGDRDGDDWLPDTQREQIEQLWKDVREDGVLDDYSGSDEEFSQVETRSLDCMTPPLRVDGGHLVWPLYGFDGLVPEDVARLVPEEHLSLRASDERRLGNLSVQALYETEAGERWWEAHGREIPMRVARGTLAWDRFHQRSRMMGGDLTGRPSPKDRLRLDAFWREVRAFCATGQGGGIDNSCGVKVMSAPDAGGGSGGNVSDWGRSSETEIWTPDKPLFRGSEKIGEIRISRPNEVRELAEAIGVTVPEIFMAAGVAVDSPARVGTGQPRVTVAPFSRVGYINVRWTARGMVTGEGFARGEKQYAGRIGASVDAVECERSISQSKTGGLSVYCSSLFIHPDFQRKGIAFEVVSRVVSSGASEIKMLAARSDDPNPLRRMTGYSTWVKYGFDCPTGRLAFESPDLDDPLEEMKRQFPGVLTLSDLVARPGGAEFWARHGGSNTLWFDTRPRSRSHTTLLDLGDRYKQKQVEGRSMSGGTDCDEDDVINGLWADFTANGLPGNPIDEEYLKSLEKEATDGSSGEVQPH